MFIVFYGFERCMISMVQCDLMYLPKGQSFTGDFGTEFTVTSTSILKCSSTICIQWIWLNRKRPGYIYQMERNNVASRVTIQIVSDSYFSKDNRFTIVGTFW